MSGTFSKLFERQFLSPPSTGFEVFGKRRLLSPREPFPLRIDAVPAGSHACDPDPELCFSCPPSQKEKFPFTGAHLFKIGALAPKSLEKNVGFFELSFLLSPPKTTTPPPPQSMTPPFEIEL